MTGLHRTWLDLRGRDKAPVVTPRSYGRKWVMAG